MHTTCGYLRLWLPRCMHKPGVSRNRHCYRSSRYRTVPVQSSLYSSPFSGHLYRPWADIPQIPGSDRHSMSTLNRDRRFRMRCLRDRWLRCTPAVRHTRPHTRLDGLFPTHQVLQYRSRCRHRGYARSPLRNNVVEGSSPKRLYGRGYQARRSVRGRNIG